MGLFPLKPQQGSAPDPKLQFMFRKAVFSLIKLSLLP